jgi:hypothetical protein
MTLKEILSKFETYASVVSAYSTLGLLITGIVGLYYIVNEFKVLSDQNEILKTTVNQSIRPVGVIALGQQKTNAVEVIGFFEGAKLDKFGLQVNYNIYNYGQGVLSYLGFFSYVDTLETNMRKGIMEGKIKRLIADSRYSFMRHETVVPFSIDSTDRIETASVINDLMFKSRYFIYTLFLYEDLAGNLYDTEHLTVMNFTEPRVVGNMVLTEPDSSKATVSKASYFSYDLQQRKMLASRIGALDSPKNHPMSFILAGSQPE